MQNKRRFVAVDVLYIALTVLPILIGIAVKILTNVPGEGISITGAQVYFTLKLPLWDLPVTESQLNSLLVTVTVFGLCKYLTHGITEKCDTKRQIIAEWIVENVNKMVYSNMGDYFKAFPPFIASIIGLSAFSSLLTLFGLYPPTSDINVVSGWAILVFILITYYKMKCGPIHYIKSFGEPVKFLAPLNIISEVATPISMAFRHYGNILSGSVISVLLASGLAALSNTVFGWLTSFPIFRVGIPAVLSIYFDVFSGCLQAYIFAMLTMLYVGGAFSVDDYIAKKEKQHKRRKTKC